MWRSSDFSGTLCRSPKTDYALSRSNLRYNAVRNPADCRLNTGTTSFAGSSAGFLGKRIQSEGSEGPSIAAAARGESDENGGKSGTQPVVGRYEASR